MQNPQILYLSELLDGSSTGKDEYSEREYKVEVNIKG